MFACSMSLWPLRRLYLSSTPPAALFLGRTLPLPDCPLINISERAQQPNFRYDLAPQHFAAVHKVFGASNASRLLLHLPEQCRSEAAIAMSFEALARMQDPVYGCVAHIYALVQVAELQEEVETLSNHIANLAVSIPGDGLQFRPSTAVMEMQEYTSQQEKWTVLENNVNWALEDDINLMFQPAYWQGENLLDVTEPKPFETPFGGIISEEVLNYLQLLPGNS